VQQCIRAYFAASTFGTAIHGVTSGCAKSLQTHGMKDLDAEQLVRLNISGFEPTGGGSGPAWCRLSHWR
jgi:hypothetical protein